MLLVLDERKDKNGIKPVKQTKEFGEQKNYTIVVTHQNA